jgi:hypothetical protein
MRILALVTIILGLAAMVLGVMFIFQASSGQQEIVDSIAPLPVDQVENMYTQVSAAVKNMPQTDPAYVATAGQKTGLGLAKANLGTVKAVRINGIVDIAVGLGLLFTGIALFARRAD